MTREESRTVQETHRKGPDGMCTGFKYEEGPDGERTRRKCGQPYPCDELTEALGVIGGTVAAT
ncbi:hypothetical protein [Stackebrandtia nassauensis]|uniref:Uncharacterized protein n=1 Tax=Stackebrandtia nassauensis (strain DSM 44728 / CIP 108903 / NRRL B-16338 / NBRC 102104 / LLR-40K-21) TaxID=446470 RepID=D3Q2G4_STANL|nr:hypothetical protein [Stackebrandtia nassauensis]ADD43897.1 hypothetical protein Snas_4248 [Stackebrandtia nassauensis DSM 44728]